MCPRDEKDYIGHVLVPSDALYGVHAMRAKDNFPIHRKFRTNWYQAVGTVKKACYLTYQNYKSELLKKYALEQIPFKLIEDDVLDALIEAAHEVEAGTHVEHFVVPFISGGAGTSINMNVNEIIANRALQILGDKPGNYLRVDPVEHANIFQSTNDVIPTALRVAILKELNILEKEILSLRLELEILEKQHKDDLRIGYTQMKEALPTTFGRLFSTYQEALSRDWWRVSKCFERIKVVNLGGGAIGTGMAIPKFFIFEAVKMLKDLTNLPVARAENLQDATSNLDPFVEIHAIFKANAVNLEKMCSDLRLLSSDLGNKQLEIPAVQVGSSIMPGKINPVITEFVIACSHKIYANDLIVGTMTAQGCLELNAYLPMIGEAILESLELLIACNKTLRENLIKGLKVCSRNSLNDVMRSPSITTALLPYIGYNRAQTLAKLMKEKNIDIFAANSELRLVSNETLVELMKPANLTKLGYTVDEIVNSKKV